MKRKTLIFICSFIGMGFLFLACHDSPTSAKPTSNNSKFLIPDVPGGLNVDSIVWVIWKDGESETLQFTSDKAKLTTDDSKWVSADSIQYFLYREGVQIGKGADAGNPYADSQTELELVVSWNSDSILYVKNLIAQNTQWLNSSKMVQEFGESELTTGDVIKPVLLEGAPEGLTFEWTVSDETNKVIYQAQADSLVVASDWGSDRTLFINLSAKHNSGLDFLDLPITIGKAGQSTAGDLFPENLDSLYKVIYGGDTLLMTLENDSITYTWSISYNDELQKVGENNIEFEVAESLVGGTLKVNITAKSNGEESNKVLLIDVTQRPSPTRLHGIVRQIGGIAENSSFERFYYTSDSNKVDTVKVFDGKDENASVLTTLLIKYGEQGRKIQATLIGANDDELIDTSWQYNETNPKIIREITQGSNVIKEELSLKNGVIYLKKRIENGQITQIISIDNLREKPITDTTFIINDEGKKELVRLVKYQYSNQRLSSKTVLLGKGDPQPYEEYRYQYNSLGKISVEKIYQLGFSENLLQTNKFTYDFSKGKLSKAEYMDESLGNLTLVELYEYEDFSPAQKWAAFKMAPRFVEAKNNSIQPSDFLDKKTLEELK